MSALKANFSRARTRARARIREKGKERECVHARRKHGSYQRVSDLKIRSYNIVLPQAALFFRRVLSFARDQ